MIFSGAGSAHLNLLKKYVVFVFPRNENRGNILYQSAACKNQTKTPVK